MKVVTIVGARPQFIKLAPVSHALRKAGIREAIVHTGQHYDHGMSEIFFAELGIPAPDHNLGVGSGHHGFQTAEMLKGIENLLISEKPDWVLVYGDTNSTLAGALAASKLHIPLAHVEAGLRSFNRRMPEEINRVLTDHISSLLFCPTETAVNNLALEGIKDGVQLVGDVMHDSLMQGKERAKDCSKILELLGLRDRGYLLATMHRAENTDDPAKLKSIMSALAKLSEAEPIIFPLHPRTRHALEALGFKISTPPLVNGAWSVGRGVITFIPPLGYLDMVRLSASSRIILTDSGGLQKEACWLEVPCVTLREETEWVETVQKGWNVLAGSSTGRILSAVMSWGQNCRRDPLPASSSASEKIVRTLNSERLEQEPAAGIEYAAT